MGLINDNTLWVFLLPSSHEAEERHIYDVVFGVCCLLSRGVKRDDILIVIDNASIDKIAACFSCFKLPPFAIYTTNDLPALLAHNTHKNAVVFVTGHGSPSGLDAPLPIKPYNIYKVFHTAKDMKLSVFIFGQCYAGVFNHIPLATHMGLPNVRRRHMVAIGGTGLFPSISASIKANGVTWNANIFLASIYLWIQNPRDIDGDNQLTVMDAFKSATINTNDCLRKIKLSENMQSILEQASLQRLLTEASTSDDKASAEKELEIQALQKRLEIRYIEQTPWVLNAPVAMSTVF